LILLKIPLSKLYLVRKNVKCILIDFLNSILKLKKNNLIKNIKYKGKGINEIINIIITNENLKKEEENLKSMLIKTVI